MLRHRLGVVLHCGTESYSASMCCLACVLLRGSGSRFFIYDIPLGATWNVSAFSRMSLGHYSLSRLFASDVGVLVP